MTRIVAGTAKGRVLAVPKSGTRPTSERVREALFSRLEHFGYVRGCIVADLFAGSGAIGLEAASRGAAQVVCVEAHAPAVKVIHGNIRFAGLSSQVCVIAKKVDTYLSAQPGEIPTFDLAVLDPPYAFSEEALKRTLALLAPHVADDAMIVVERDKKSPEPSWPDGWELVDERAMGDTRIWSAQLTALEACAR